MWPGFFCVWFALGYAKEGKGSASVLAGQFWPASGCRNLEDGASLRDRVYLEGEVLRDASSLASRLNPFSFTP